MGLDDDTETADIDPVKLAAGVAAAMTGWSQKKLAAASGIPQGRISAILSNYRGERVTIGEAMRIEDAVGLPRGYIYAFAGAVTAEGARRGEEAAARADRAG